jgi:hypothetical protein
MCRSSFEARSPEGHFIVVCDAIDESHFNYAHIVIIDDAKQWARSTTGSVPRDERDRVRISLR